MVFQDAGARLHELLNRGLREVLAVGLGDAPIDLPQQLARLLLGLRKAVEEVHLAREGVEERIQPSADEPLARHLADIEILGDGVIRWNWVPTSDGRPILLSRQRSLVWSLRHTSLAGKGTFIEFDDYFVLEVVPALNLEDFSSGEPAHPITHVKLAAQAGLSKHFANGNWHWLSKHGATAAILVAPSARVSSADTDEGPATAAAASANAPSTERVVLQKEIELSCTLRELRPARSPGGSSCPTGARAALGMRPGSLSRNPSTEEWL
eukprot:CAMPEP_0177351104 /NCGR_PEP_ID=MMETSP0368-20130122/31666_1 /TAXON_ID=447022 ORGANISM="Scrippsiella hangoei-like, Strain SHHI-4" /NCGR_SAMPLE_ID=MMETSP0368 /ASSEMBLY_ACC=CAM_ASM_000363 /LENGTH=266 /DNA_ID=CAMNT_0018813051 /DNA_START=633 /DNA_END=1431 /DNA_ORIENTATION=+